jgi:hypothetical protein
VPKVYAPEFRWTIVELPLFGNAEVFFGAAGTAAQDGPQAPHARGITLPLGPAQAGVRRPPVGPLAIRPTRER